MSNPLSNSKRRGPANWPPARKLFRLVVGFAILALILRLVDVRELARTLLALDPKMVLALIAIAMVSRVLRAFKWNLLLRARDIRISYGQAIRLSLVSHFVGAWTPGNLGGDAYRVVALRKFGKTNVVLATVLIERYAGLLTVCLFVLLTLPITIPYLLARSPLLVGVIVGMIAIVALALPLLFSPKVARQISLRLPAISKSDLGRKLRDFYRTLLQYREHPLTLAAFALLTISEVLSYFVMNYLSARALGMDVSLLFFLCAMPVVHLLLRIPISVQGLGVQEGCFVFALALHGIAAPETKGVAVSLVQRAVEWLMAIAPGGLLLWLTRGPDAQTVAASDSSVSTERVADLVVLYRNATNSRIKIGQTVHPVNVRRDVTTTVRTSLASYLRDDHTTFVMPGIATG